MVNKVLSLAALLCCVHVSASTPHDNFNTPTAEIRVFSIPNMPTNQTSDEDSGPDDVVASLEEVSVGVSRRRGHSFGYSSPISPSAAMARSFSIQSDLGTVATHIPEMKDDLVLISGSANKTLAGKIAKALDLPIDGEGISTFNDGECNINIAQNMRGRHVFVIQPTCATEEKSVNDSFMELALTIGAARRASAREITAVVPYYGYARQDRKSKKHVPISAADTATMLEAMGLNRLVVVDLHCGQIQGFFHNPVDNLLSSKVFADEMEEFRGKPLTLVSPDAGGVERVKKFRDFLTEKDIHADIAIVLKQRAAPGVVESIDLVGSVAGKYAVILDDIVDTGGTLCKVGEKLAETGAIEVHAYITHGIFSRDAYNKIDASPFKQIVITDTIPLKGDVSEKIKVVSVAPLLAGVIERIHNHGSVSDIFDPPYE